MNVRVLARRGAHTVYDVAQIQTISQLGLRAWHLLVTFSQALIVIKSGRKVCSCIGGRTQSHLQPPADDVQRVSHSLTQCASKATACQPRHDMYVPLV